MATLFVVGTPIGNRGDLSARASTVLKSVDLIVSEKPLASKKLLDPLGVKKPIISIFEPGKRFATERVIEALEQNKNTALISEAGTPGINDPGGVIVSAVRQAGYVVQTVPGANAAIAAASISGFPMDQFVYKGFVPHKKGRETFFKQLAIQTAAVIFYESPHRIEKTLATLAELVPERYLCIARELTKLHEQSIVDTARAIAVRTPKQLPRLGEFVLVLAPKDFVPHHS
ncbi:MAG: 16S rRNA (cytidine(1402)-2'-O)-methyltransferase [Parcubacteria group bacterium]